MMVDRMLSQESCRCCPGPVSNRQCMALGIGPEGWGPSVGRRGSQRARVSVLLIAPFAFKEIKLFLVCATAGETPEEAFPSLRFSGSCQVWSSAQFWEPLRAQRRGHYHLGARGQAGVCAVAPRGPCHTGLPGVCQPWPAERSNPMRLMFVMLCLKKSNLFSNYSLSCITVHCQSVAI